MAAAGSGHDLRTATLLLFKTMLFCLRTAAAIHQSHALQIAHRPLFADKPTPHPIHGHQHIHHEPGTLLVQAEATIITKPAAPVQGSGQRRVVIDSAERLTAT
jgi:hypothetical protein